MQKPCGEGLAIHVVPESCGVSGNGGTEALTGVRTGWVLSPEIKTKNSECRRASRLRKAIFHALPWRGVCGLGGVGDPMHVQRHIARESGGPAFDFYRLHKSPRGEP
ncbi:MAG: hypothetical protein IMF00_05190 [Proteobacteria bacterium]|nr:hypothetical protein [Pseudomonadota bacterium]